METTRTGLVSASRTTSCVREALTRTATQIHKVWNALVTRARPSRKSLSILETTALGDRRFVAVVQFEQRRFLIGSSPASVTLLTRLPDSPSDATAIANTGGSR